MDERKKRRRRGQAAEKLLREQLAAQSRAMTPVIWISLFAIAIAAAVVAVIAHHELSR